VVVRNFGSDGFDSVTERLDSLVDLGINAIWLSPVNTSLPGLFGYEVVDYFDLDQRYGDKEEFRRLIEAAHQRGVRVLMDFVPSHTSERHPYFLDTLDKGEASPYWDFYARDENGMYTYYFNYTHLPLLNYEHPEVRRWMLEAMTYWVREFDIDGYRVDVAWGIKERRPEFWMEWRHALKRIKPDVLLIAEAGARDPYYFSNGFDAAYDWTNELGHWAWESVFEDDNLLTFNLHSALTYRRAGGFDPDALIFRFLNNNDTGTRFITRYGEDRTRVAAALLLTLPGIPCVYTGDEYGEAFLPYSESTPLAWREQYEGLRDYYKSLITLRRSTPSLHSRTWTPVNAEPHTQIYSYLRHLEDNSQLVLVLLNFFDESAEVTVDYPEAFAEVGNAQSFQDLLTGATVAVNDGAISLPPYGVMILAPLAE
jgi:cyclomaltodextrinase